MGVAQNGVDMEEGTLEIGMGTLSFQRLHITFFVYVWMPVWLDDCIYLLLVFQFQYHVLTFG